MRTDVIFNTDAASGLGRLPDNSIDCIVTSPPYWQLRDYGLSPILFGGRQDCEHDFDDYAICRSCGGWLGQLGQEPSREMFLEHLMGIFDECRRVLKSTGTLWVNLGDSYSKLNKYNRPDDWPPGKNAHCLKTLRVDLSMHRIPHKSLCNIPGLFAEMMILRGWILRNEIIWYKPSAVPTPVKDRFTVDFEKVFFFAKSPKYDFRQQFEPYAGNETNRISRQPEHPTGSKSGNDLQGRNKRTVWRITTEISHEKHYAPYPQKLIETPIEAGCPPGGVVLDPFLGSGTTALVARRLGRHYIGIEPNPEYVAIARSRLERESEPSKQ